MRTTIDQLAQRGKFINLQVASALAGCCLFILLLFMVQDMLSTMMAGVLLVVILGGPLLLTGALAYWLLSRIIPVTKWFFTHRIRKVYYPTFRAEIIFDEQDSKTILKYRVLQISFPLYPWMVGGPMLFPLSYVLYGDGLFWIYTQQALLIFQSLILAGLVAGVLGTIMYCSLVAKRQ